MLTSYSQLTLCETQTFPLWQASVLCWIQSSVVRRHSSLFGHVV